MQSLTDGIESLWIEHPKLGRKFDVVALPLRVPPENEVLPYGRDPGPPLAIHMASEIAVIGFPEGMASAGITAIWKSGTIASEVDLSLDESGYFWIDSNTRRGMSGAPVVARRFGGALMEDGNYAIGTGVSDRVLGVYAGRAFDAPDMTLGRVWGWDNVQVLLDHASQEVLLRNFTPVAAHIGHIPQEEAGMPALDVTKSVTANIRLPNGSVETKTISVGDIIREMALTDDRFGVSLERVKVAATIDGALEAAVNGDGNLVLDAQQYALIVECIEQPSKGFNPVVARHILPLLDYVVEAANS